LFSPIACLPHTKILFFGVGAAGVLLWGWQIGTGFKQFDCIGICISHRGTKTLKRILKNFVPWCLSGKKSPADLSSVACATGASAKDGRRLSSIGNGNSGENPTRRAGATARQEQFNGKNAFFTHLQGLNATLQCHDVSLQRLDVSL